jgi:hypothetical protein
VSNCYVSSRAGRCPAQLPGRKLKPAVNQVMSLQGMTAAAPAFYNGSNYIKSSKKIIILKKMAIFTPS